MRYLLRHALFKNTNILDVRDFSNQIFWGDIDGGESVSIEGGDIVILNEQTLMVGTGERTTKAAFILLLDLLEKFGSPVRTVIRALIPQARASMHLDTVFTVLTDSEAMAYRPVVNDYEYQVYHAPYKDDPLNRSFKEAMKAAGLAHLKCLSCGDENRLSQSREQWTDGANLFAIAPRVLIGYDRNPVTAQVLKNSGYKCLQAITDGKKIEKIAADFNACKDVGPVMIAIPGAELSRARGGARCMTMPLVRDNLQTSP
jgi:arginine deiminase